MTAPVTLNVEYEELMARADEIEAAVPGLPTDIPQAPCLLGMVTAAAEQIGMSAENMRLYLRVGLEREWVNLAGALRQAAKAYEEVDEDAGEAIDNGTSMSVSSVSALTPAYAGDLDTVLLSDTPQVQAVPVEYQDLKQRCWELESTDRGAAFDHFADAWTAYRRALLQTTLRFRPFESYEGSAAYAIEVTMDRQRQWVISMAELCRNLINQARAIASTQRWALSKHILWYGEKLIDYKYLDEFEKIYARDPAAQAEYNKYYAEWQQISDDVMTQYESKAALPVPVVNPLTPPYVQRAGGSGDGPPSGGDGPPSGGDGPPSGGDNPSGPYDPQDDLPSYPTTPTGAMPSTGMAGMPSTPPTPTDIPPPVTPAMPGSAGVKPASVGGGGAGVPSIPSMPLADPSAGAATTSSAAGAGSRPPIPAAYAALNGASAAGGAGGGMPMAPGAGQGQNAGKGKRASDDQQELYIERRAWTEGVIGNRPRKPATEKMVS
jgi:hypothetical protein